MYIVIQHIVYGKTRFLYTFEYQKNVIYTTILTT